MSGCHDALRQVNPIHLWQLDDFIRNHINCLLSWQCGAPLLTNNGILTEMGCFLAAMEAK